MWGHHADTSGTGITCGTPAFASCHLARIAARCSHLLKVDLTGINIGGMLAGTSMPEMVQLVRSSTRLDSFRARDKAPVDCLLVHELASLPLLTSLSLANTDVTDEAFHAAVALSAEGQACFPSLRRLSVAHCARLAGAGLVAIVQVVPSLQALSVDGCSQLRADIVVKLSGLNVGRSVPISISAILHTAAHGFQPASDRAPGPLGTHIMSHRRLPAPESAPQALVPSVANGFLMRYARWCVDVRRDHRCQLWSLSHGTLAGPA